MAVVHCHPPHATAFAVAHEPIPKCILPEVEVFLGEVPVVKYETPGGQAFADTIAPYVKDCNTILLANHGTVTFGPTLENAYFNSEIIDAYCRILILSRLLGRVNYFDDQKTKELLTLKKRLGYDDIRFRDPSCAVCGPSNFDESYSDFVPQPFAFPFDDTPYLPGCNLQGNGRADGRAPREVDMDELVQLVTDRVMEALTGVDV
jgi:L-fuculose-phosphate aldolase